MTLQKFCDKFNGKPCDFDKNGSFQCVDLARQKLVDVDGISGWSLPPVQYAKELYTKFKPTVGFEKIQNVWNDLNCAPTPGDLVIWGWYPGVTGFAGHVGVCTWSDGRNLIVFNQNHPTGTLCTLRKFSYRGVLGWIRRV